MKDFFNKSMLKHLFYLISQRFATLLWHHQGLQFREKLGNITANKWFNLHLRNSFVMYDEYTT